MPSRIESIATGTTTIKVVSVPKSAGDGGLPGTTLVMDERTGGVDAVVNARSLTALRTAAASTLATKLCLGPAANPTRLLFFGAGAQTHAHAALLIATFPTIKHCTIVNRSHNNRLVTLLAHFRAQFPGVEIVGLAGNAFIRGQGDVGIERVVRSASIICTATSSTEPLFPAAWVPSHAHINLIGSYTPLMHEVSSELIGRAKVVIVDSRAACAKEAGELISAGLSPEKTLELGELGHDTSLAGKDEGDITIFKTVGVGAMDVAIAKLVVDKAREQRFGASIPYD